MMTKPKSLGNSLCRQIAIIPVVALSVFAFSTKSFAQDAVKAPNAAVSQTKSVAQSSSFLILVETTEDGVKLTSQEGCAWKELIFKVNQDTPQAIDQYGMTSLNKDKATEDKKLANFVFIIKKTKDGVSLEGKDGTAWVNLSFSCEGKCSQYIDFGGMAQKE